MKRLLLTIVLLISILLPGLKTQAQQAIEIVETNVVYEFEKHIIFKAKANWISPPKTVQIFFKSKNDVDTIVGEVSVQGNELLYVHDLVRYPLKAFSEIQYWYGVQADGEASAISGTFSFFYEDNRYKWQKLEEHPFRVHWYEGDLEFGQMVLDVARGSLDHAQGLLTLQSPDNVDIFVYADGAALQSTLNLAGLAMVAGHADPELGVMFVSLPPGATQELETERQVPHELMHILLFQKFGKDYADLPTWILEGLASLNETYPNPDYVTVLQDAVKKEALIPMASLCHGFPAEASKFFQSYAQSDSFTRYLFQEYGADGLMEMIRAYAGGVECERGAEIGLGKTLTQLDVQWQRETFRQSPFFKALAVVFPWAFILLFILLAPFLMVFNSLFRLKSNGKKLRESST